MLATDPNYKLSENFPLYDATRSQIATRNGINNMPPIELLPVLSLVATHILEPVRYAFVRPITPSSWFRCQGLERALKSKPASWISEGQHPKGRAVDFEVPGIPNLELARYIEAEVDFDQLILEYWDPADPRAGWVHASYVSESANRGEVLTFDGRNYSFGFPD